jgi:hypothetical protein
MSKKAGIGIGISLVVVILIVWVGLTASAMGGESSAADSYLKAAIANKTPQAEVSNKLKEMGFTMTDSPGSSTGVGPTHSLVVYSTHLTVNLTFDKDGNTLSYHIDKS